MEFEVKVEKSREIAAQQKSVKAKMDGLIWKQHSQFPRSWTEERNARISTLGLEYDRLDAEYRAVWSA